MTFLETFISFNVMEHTGLSFYNMKKRREAMKKTVLVLSIVFILLGLFTRPQKYFSQIVSNCPATDMQYCSTIDDWSNKIS